MQCGVLNGLTFLVVSQAAACSTRLTRQKVKMRSTKRLDDAIDWIVFPSQEQTIDDFLHRKQLARLEQAQSTSSIMAFDKRLEWESISQTDVGISFSKIVPP